MPNLRDIYRQTQYLKPLITPYLLRLEGRTDTFIESEPTDLYAFYFHGDIDYPFPTGPIDFEVESSSWRDQVGDAGANLYQLQYLDQNFEEKTAWAYAKGQNASNFGVDDIYRIQDLRVIEHGGIPNIGILSCTYNQGDVGPFFLIWEGYGYARNMIYTVPKGKRAQILKGRFGVENPNAVVTYTLKTRVPGEAWKDHQFRKLDFGIQPYVDMELEGTLWLEEGTDLRVKCITDTENTFATGYLDLIVHNI